LNSGELLVLEKIPPIFPHSTEIISLTWIQQNLDCWSLETHLTESLVRWLEPHTISVLLLVGFFVVEKGEVKSKWKQLLVQAKMEPQLQPTMRKECR
jgi:hypothetical protein